MKGNVVGMRRNQCRGCGCYFNSIAAFDKHSIGKFGRDRRCMTEDEMRAAGMERNRAGYWVSSRWERDHA